MRQIVAQALSSRIWSWLRADAPKPLFITNPCTRIFLVSFTMLFFELLCIRWIPSYVRFLSYFNNFILMASFLGIGLGMLAARRKRFWYLPFPLMVLLLAVVVALNRFEVRINSTEVLYLTEHDREIRPDYLRPARLAHPHFEQHEPAPGEFFADAGIGQGSTSAADQ